MPAPVMTLGAAGNLLASVSLVAAGTQNFLWDLSSKFEGQLSVKVTAGGTVAATFGVKVQCYAIYQGSTYDDAGTAARDQNPNFAYTLGGYIASDVAYTPMIALPTGKWKVVLTNLDATNAVTVEVTGNTVDSIT